LPIYHKAGETDLIDLIIEDEEGKTITKKVLVQEVNRDYINNKPLHLDFYEVEMDKPVTTHVPSYFCRRTSCREIRRYFSKIYG